MASTIKFIDSYVNYPCTVNTYWGNTYMQAETEDDLFTALKTVLPRGEVVQIILGKVSMDRVINSLKQIYTIKIL